jgi:hypothetical protein
MTKRARHKPPQRTYQLKLDGELADFHVTMGAMSARELIRIRSGEMSEGEAIEFTATKIIEHDFDVADIRDVDYWILLAISQAWSAAMRDAAVPPVPGDS